MAEAVKVGILGKGTVGAAFRELLESRAEMVAEVSGKRPAVAGVLSSREGDFAEFFQNIAKVEIRAPSVKARLVESQVPVAFVVWASTVMLGLGQLPVDSCQC